MPKRSTLAYQKKTFWSNRSPCYTTHLCQPILNQSPKDAPLNFTSLGLRLSSHTSLFWTLPQQLSMLHHACEPTHPEPTSQDTLQTSDPKIFTSNICFELCRNSSPCYTTHVSQPILNQRPMTHYKLQIQKFSSHTSLFWILPEQITPRMCANPEPTFQDTPQNLRPQDVHLTHPCFELCRSSSPYYIHHACVPTLNQRSKDTPQHLRP